MNVSANTPAPVYDLVVVGSGAAGMAAAITATLGGLSVAILEKAPHYGGSTAVSGGAIWIPDNPKMREGGMSDDRDAARTYLAAETGNRMNAPLVDAFLENGPEMVAFFEKHTALQFEHREFSPDYHPDREGAAMGGRVLDAVDYDGRRLGKNFGTLKPPIEDFTVFGGMMLNRFDIGHFMKMTRSTRSALHAAGLLLRHLRDRMTHPRGTRLVLGQAVAGRLAESVFKLGIPLFLETSLIGIAKDNGKVSGVRVDHKGVPLDIVANHGVVLGNGRLPAGHRPTRRAHAARQGGSAAFFDVPPGRVPETQSPWRSRQVPIWLKATATPLSGPPFHSCPERMGRAHSPTCFSTAPNPVSLPLDATVGASRTRRPPTTTSSRGCWVPDTTRHGSSVTTALCAATGWALFGPSPPPLATTFVPDTSRRATRSKSSPRQSMYRPWRCARPSNASDMLQGKDMTGISARGPRPTRPIWETERTSPTPVWRRFRRLPSTPSRSFPVTLARASASKQTRMDAF